jgi:hypothetical protein
LATATTVASCMALGHTLPTTLSRFYSHALCRVGARGESLISGLEFRTDSSFAAARPQTKISTVRVAVAPSAIPSRFLLHSPTRSSGMITASSRTFWYAVSCSHLNCTLILLQPFTWDFPRADIHELLSPDLLHQVIKGTFKDHLVTWVGEYLELVHGAAEAKKIMADIDRRSVHRFCAYISLIIPLQHCRCSCVSRIAPISRRTRLQAVDGG